MKDIKAYIEKNRLSQKYIAAQTGYRREYISRLLQGKHELNIKFLAKFKQAFPDFGVEESQTPNVLDLEFRIHSIEADVAMIKKILLRL